MRFDGNRGATGFARGQARVVLQAEGPDRTRLLYVSTAQFGGKIAQIGSRRVDAAAGAMSEKFFAAFCEPLTSADAAIAGTAGKPAAASLGWWSLLGSIVRRLFGRR